MRAGLSKAAFERVYMKSLLVEFALGVNHLAGCVQTASRLYNLFWCRQRAHGLGSVVPSLTT